MKEGGGFFLLCQWHCKFYSIEVAEVAHNRFNSLQLLSTTQKRLDGFQLFWRLHFGTESTWRRYLGPIPRYASNYHILIKEHACWCHSLWIKILWSISTVMHFLCARNKLNVDQIPMERISQHNPALSFNRIAMLQMSLIRWFFPLPQFMDQQWRVIGAGESVHNCTHIFRAIFYSPLQDRLLLVVIEGKIRSAGEALPLSTPIPKCNDVPEFVEESQRALMFCLVNVSQLKHRF